MPRQAARIKRAWLRWQAGAQGRGSGGGAPCEEGQLFTLATARHWPVQLTPGPHPPEWE